MLKKKSSSSEKKRKHSQSEERHESGKRRSAESNIEDSKDELADPDLDRIGSDIEEGGLNLSLPFQPITAYIGDKREMLDQCFRVLGEKKLQKMLPDELKDCSLEEIKKLCWDQLEPVTEKNLIQILAGEELISTNTNEVKEEMSESQQDNNVDSTSCLKETAKTEEPKQEAGVSSEESDVLSINADTCDSDIEGPKDDQTAKLQDRVGKGAEQCNNPTSKPEPTKTEPKPGPEAKKDIQSDIDRSVSEILALSSESGVKEPSGTQQPSAGDSPAEGIAISGHPVLPSQPSVQQLELLELEMRARAIKALMKASDEKKACAPKNM